MPMNFNVNLVLRTIYGSLASVTARSFLWSIYMVKQIRYVSGLSWEDILEDKPSRMRYRQDSCLFLCASRVELLR